MSQIVIPFNEFAQFTVQGVDASGNPQNITGTATIDNYAAAFVVNYGSHNYAIFPKGYPAAGQSTVVNVNFMAKSADGSSLAPLVVTAVIQGPTPPPPAAALLEGTPAVQGGAGMPSASDPGSATINLTN